MPTDRAPASSHRIASQLRGRRRRHRRRTSVAMANVRFFDRGHGSLVRSCVGPSARSTAATTAKSVTKAVTRVTRLSCVCFWVLFAVESKLNYVYIDRMSEDGFYSESCQRREPKVRASVRRRRLGRRTNAWASLVILLFLLVVVVFVLSALDGVD